MGAGNIQALLQLLQQNPQLMEQLLQQARLGSPAPPANTSRPGTPALGGGLQPPPPPPTGGASPMPGSEGSMGGGGFQRAPGMAPPPRMPQMSNPDPNMGPQRAPGMTPPQRPGGPMRMPQRPMPQEGPGRRYMGFGGNGPGYGGGGAF